MFKAVFIDQIFDDISLVKEILAPIAVVYNYQCTSEKEVIEAATDADAVMVINYAPVSRSIIERLEKCKIISRFGIGLDAVDLKAASEKGIIVTNVPDYCLDEVSDHAIAMMLCLERKLRKADNYVRVNRRYKPLDLYPIKGLRGAVTGIIGFGRIGKLSAKKCAAFGSDVVFYDPFVENDWEFEGVKARKVSLKELLQNSDNILIHAPYTKENYHLINEETLSYTEKKPCIINVGRGELIDTGALVKAIKSGLVSAAGLDVLEDFERLSPEDEIFKLKNVSLSPHSAWYSENAKRKLQTSAATSVTEALSGIIPANCVNKDMLRK